MFPCEYCGLFKNTCFKEQLQTAGSKTPVRGFASQFNHVPVAGEVEEKEKLKNLLNCDK